MICNGPDFVQGSLYYLELSNNIRSLIINNFDLFLTLLALKMNPSLSKLRGNVMKSDQDFVRDPCSRNGSHCEARLCNTSHSYVITIVIIIVLFPFQKIKQSDLEHFPNVNMNYHSQQCLKNVSSSVQLITVFEKRRLEESQERKLKNPS